MLTCSAKAASPVTSLQIRNEGTNVEGLQVYSLEWPAISNSTYKIQSTTNLGGSSSATIWRKDELEFTTSNGPLRWLDILTVDLDTNGDRVQPPMKFYQVELPQTEIFSIEPAFVAVGEEVEAYLFGQCFDSNVTLRLIGPGGPLALTNRPVINPNTMSVRFVAPAEGSYEFEFEFPDGSVRRGPDKIYVVTVPNGKNLRSLVEPPRAPFAEPTETAPTLKKWTSTMTPGSHHMVKAAAARGGVGQAGDVYEQHADAVADQLPFNNWPGEIDVTPFTAEVQVRVIDMSVPGRGIDFVFARTYRSQTGIATPMGNGWDHSYNIFVQQLGGDIVVHSGDGRADRYVAGSNGVYSAVGFFNEGQLSDPNDFQHFTLKFPNGGMWTFRAFDGSPSAGKIASIADRYGNFLRFSYDAATGLLNLIIDTLGRAYHFSYDSNGRLTQVEDFAGRAIKGDYYVVSDADGNAGDLKTLTSPSITGTPNGNDFPDGKTTRYTYSTGSKDDRLNHNLLTVTDPKNQTWLQFVYHINTNPADLDYDCVREVIRGGEQTALHREVTKHPAKVEIPNLKVVAAVIRDPLGNVSEEYFDSQNRLILHRDYTGHADPLAATTLTQNRPQNPLRTNDPLFFETSVEWNRDSLPATIKYPQGNSERFVYRQDFGPVMPSKRGDLMSAHQIPCCRAADMDRDGLPDLFERVWRFDYAPNFGSPARNMRDRINALEAKLQNIGLIAKMVKVSGVLSEHFAGLDASGNLTDSTRLGRPGINEGLFLNNNDFYCRKRIFRTLRMGLPLIDNTFATSSTDPRGNVTTAEYDASGNRVKVKFPWLPNTDETFAYNIFGQLIAKTNAPDGEGRRCVDTVEYYDNPAGPNYGRIAHLIHDANGARLQTTFEYDGRGYVSRIIDPRTNDWIFTHNATGLTTERQTPDTSFGARIKTQFTYDADDNLTFVAHDNFDENGSTPAGEPPAWTTQLAYDELNRVVRMCRNRDAGHSICRSFSYDANDNCVLDRSGEYVNGNDSHAVIRYKYDERNLLFQTTWAPGSSDEANDQIDYTPNGLKSVQWEPHKAPGLDAPELERTIFTYDGFDRPDTITDAMGNMQEFGFDANNNLKVWRHRGELIDVPGGAANIRLAETQWSYDSLNRPIECRVGAFDPITLDLKGDGINRTTFTYAPNSWLLAETDDADHTTRYTYDTASRLIMITDAKTNTVTYTYDNNGNVASITPRNRADLGGVAVGSTLSFTYDALNRRTSSSDNVGNNENWFFGSRDLCVRHVNPNGVTTVTTYDGVGRRLKLYTDKNGDGTMHPGEMLRSFVWDDNNRLTSETDGNSNTTYFAYDSCDRRVLATSPDGTPHTFVWNARGSLESSTDPNGTVVSNRFDLLERCIRRDIIPGGSVMATTTFEMFAYDGMSRCVRASNDVSLAEFNFDSMDNEVRARLYGHDVLLIYDQNGDRASMTYPSGLVLNYTYDALRHVKTVVKSSSIGSATLASFDYEGDRLARISRANGISTRIQWDGADNPPNAQEDFGWQQISLVNHQTTNSGSVIDRRMFGYDRNQNKILRQQLVSFSTPQTLTTNTFHYDALNRMTGFERRRASTIATKSFELDNNGNRLFTTSNGVVFPYSMDNAQPEPADFQMDQYTMTPFGPQQYDRNGNLVLTASTSPTTSPTFYRYDYADRLVEVSTFGDDGTPRVLASFSYDALGRRISKTVPGGPAPALPMTTQFIYDGNEIIEERDGNGVLQVSYTRFPGDNTPIVKGSALGGLLNATRNGHEQFYHNDDLGNVLAITDENGAVLERYDYDEYGMPRFYSADGVPLGVDGTPASSSSIGNRFLFHGMEWDGEIGLYLSRHRPTQADPFPDPPNYLDPKTGRVLSRAGDAIQRGANQFTFAGDNPWSGKMARVSSGGDPIHGVDVKRGWGARSSNGDPIHGVDVKLGWAARSSGGDPIHGVDVKLGWSTRSSSGDPVHGVDVKLGWAARSSGGDPVHGVDVKLGWSARGGGNTLFNPPPMGTAFRAREATTRARNVAQAIQQVQRQRVAD